MGVDSEEPPFVVVLSIIAAKNIPSQENHNFVVDARLDTELLSTDPAPHDNGTTLFEIQSELAWQMSKKTLHAHRLKRTPVKLSVFSHNLASNERKQTGQIVLDLRSLAMPEHLKDADLATVNSLQPKWYPILHSTYWKKQGNLQPEILLKLSIEIDGQEPIENQILKNQIGSPKKRAAAPRTPKKQTDSEKDGEKFIQIGNPAKTSQEKYTFSLCLKNLTGVFRVMQHCGGGTSMVVPHEVPHEVPPTEIFSQKKLFLNIFLMIFGVLIENSVIFESFSMSLHCFGGFSRFWPSFNGFQVFFTIHGFS